MAISQYTLRDLIIGRRRGRDFGLWRLCQAPLGKHSVQQFASFFLLPPSQYTQSGQRPICAEYIGRGYVRGSPRPGAGSSGYYVVRLVQ